MKNKKIAALLTCHNRREKTISCLSSLYNCQLPALYELDVFLVDDGSTDGTTEAVNKYFPCVNMIQGSGNLFWNQGMRLAWSTAVQANEYDFFLWLNDDTLLEGHAIIELLAINQEIMNRDHKPAIVCGACRSSDEANDFSYGGRNDSGPVFPNGQIQTCKYINGNAVLVPKEIFKVIGYLSPNYTHSLGDIDYGLRVLKENLNCYTTKTFIATCPPNEKTPAWCNPDIPFKYRWDLFHSPKGFNIHEYIVFRKIFWNWTWMMYAFKAYLKILFPRTYLEVRNIMRSFLII